LPLARGGTSKRVESVLPHAPIFTPDDHDSVKEPSRKRQFERDRQDARKTRRPDVGTKVNVIMIVSVITVAFVQATIEKLRDPKSNVGKLGAGGGVIAAHLVNCCVCFVF
jgi:hypothetical protein